MPISTLFSAMICLYRTSGLGFIGGKVLFPSVQFVQCAWAHINLINARRGSLFNEIL